MRGKSGPRCRRGPSQRSLLLPHGSSGAGGVLSGDSERMEMFFGSFFSESASSQNIFGHPNVERCPFLRNIDGATSFSFSSALPVAARGGKGPIFEEGPGFDSAFKLFHGRDGIVPLSGRSSAPDENNHDSIDVKPAPALPFNPLAARAATISLSAFGPFGFNFFNGKGKRQNKKPNNLNQSNKKPNNPNQNSMKTLPVPGPNQRCDQGKHGKPAHILN
ncbi:hypothetical protein GUJ93_ZPchr0006g44776 [Zizania palustris]|uniref:Uncharacterized protein n=1 Tax=Zizania palustris TaxID=103762 RepID=A0A8J5SI63_ZIZPA|nr:hypothetical protein GUJ93_ZPchr0006g44776 [Zizania palustris]